MKLCNSVLSVHIFHSKNCSSYLSLHCIAIYVQVIVWKRLFFSNIVGMLNYYTMKHYNKGRVSLTLVRSYKCFDAYINTCYQANKIGYLGT